MSWTDRVSKCFRVIEIQSTRSPFRRPEPSWQVDHWRASCTFGTSRRESISRVSRARVISLKSRGTKKKVESPRASLPTSCASLTSTSRLTWWTTNERSGSYSTFCFCYHIEFDSMLLVSSVQYANFGYFLICWQWPLKLNHVRLPWLW